MKNKLRDKKFVYGIIGIVSVLLVALAITYAYWLVTKTQEGENVISSACLDISVSNEANDITLSNQFPISDEEGMKLVPYEFTVTNNCNTSVDYQVSLEATGDSSTAIASSALKVALDDTSKLYSAYSSVETTIEGAYESRKLGMGTLSASENEGSSVTYELRIWIDEDAPISEMNKTFASRISVTIGQGISNPLKEVTLAYDIVSQATSIGEIDPTWVEGAYGSETYQSMPASTSYYWGTEMNFDNTTGKYKLGGTIVQATTAECRNGQKSDGTAISCLYTLRNSNNAEYETRTGYKVTALTNSSKTDTSSTLYITVQKTGTPTNGFSSSTSNQGLNKTQDDLGDSYYFRGNVTNNYVQFGSYAANSTVNGTTYTEETPMYWRIIRINGDGTIRLAYDGTAKSANGTSTTSLIGYSAFNSNYDDAKYVGYTYEGTNEAGETVQVDSTIKGVLDIWYDKHLESSYGDKIADSIFCNDRSEASYTFYDENYSTITDPNAAVYTDIYYGAYDRLNTYNTPSLKCTNKEDRYTVNDTTNGNGLLSNPVGLITADEEKFAGISSDYYLYLDDWYWTSTPCSWNVGDGHAAVCTVDYGNLNGDYVDHDGYGVRPVINLKADVLFEGNGSYETPYVIKSQ